MSYNLEFDPRALKEWRKLGDDVRLQFKKKLEQVLQLIKMACTGCRTATKSNSVPPVIAWSIRCEVKPLRYLSSR